MYSLTKRSFVSRFAALVVLLASCSGPAGSSAPVQSQGALADSSTSGGSLAALAEGGTHAVLGAAGISTAGSPIGGLAGFHAWAGMGPIGSEVKAAAVSPPQAPEGSVHGQITTQPAQAAKHGVVYLEDGPLNRVVDTRLDDHKMTFFPFVSLMTAGGTLTYVNSEPFPDSAYSLSNEKWDFGLVESRGSRKRVFPNPGIYTILCQLHPNQVAYLIVSPSSYYARTDKNGQYIMSNVPAGTYEAVAWAPRLPLKRQSVTITPGGDVVLDFSLKRN
jgi:plastocyanin